MARGKRDTHSNPELPFEKREKNGEVSYAIPEKYRHLFPQTRIQRFNSNLRHYAERIPALRKSLITEIEIAEHLIDGLNLIHGEQGKTIRETINRCENTASMLKTNLNIMEEQGKLLGLDPKDNRMDSIAKLRKFLDSIEKRAAKLRNKFESALRGKGQSK